MEYKTDKKPNDAVYVTSKLSLGMDKPRRIKDGIMVESHVDDPAPLVRIYSRDRTIYKDGVYALAIKEGSGWDILVHRFPKAGTAEKYLPGLQMIYDEVAVVQFWTDEQLKKHVNWDGLVRNDPGLDEETGEI